jgi:hypothetical protein
VALGFRLMYGIGLAIEANPTDNVVLSITVLCFEMVLLKDAE